MPSDKGDPFMPRSISCSTCGAHMWFDPKTKRPIAQRICRPCRRESPAYTFAGCIDCGVPSTGNRCRTCFGLSQRIWGTDTQQARRNARERVPGLPRSSRRKMLHRWIAQGRSCTFCDHPCETVDHVVPLARGGTNYEGNLTPACRSCNSSRGSRLLVEWRTPSQVFSKQPLVTTPEYSFPPRGLRVA